METMSPMTLESLILPTTATSGPLVASESRPIFAPPEFLWVIQRGGWRLRKIWTVEDDNEVEHLAIFSDQEKAKQYQSIQPHTRCGRICHTTWKDLVERYKGKYAFAALDPTRIDTPLKIYKLR